LWCRRLACRFAANTAAKELCRKQPPDEKLTGNGQAASLCMGVSRRGMSKMIQQG
jgi:hypothetical protein